MSNEKQILKLLLQKQEMKEYALELLGMKPKKEKRKIRVKIDYS